MNVKNKNTLTVTLAIPTFNRKRFIQKNLDGLISQGLSDNLKILVSDNGSLDGTYEALKEQTKAYPQVKVIGNSHNLGFYGNMIRLLESVDTDYILFCSDEDLVDMESIREIEVYLRQDNPDFASAAFFDGEKIQRRSSGTCNLRTIEKASVYISGLIFKMRSITEAIEFLREQTNNHYVYVYPQCVLALYVFLFKERCQRYPVCLSRHIFQDDCDHGEEKPWLIESRIRQIRGIFSLYECLKPLVPNERAGLLEAWFLGHRKYVFSYISQSLAQEHDRRIHASFLKGLLRYFLSRILRAPLALVRSMSFK
jgi:glycosyltransferase involved in cell wall biosynthesis